MGELLSSRCERRYWAVPSRFTSRRAVTTRLLHRHRHDGYRRGRRNRADAGRRLGTYRHQLHPHDHPGVHEHRRHRLFPDISERRGSGLIARDGGDHPELEPVTRGIRNGKAAIAYSIAGDVTAAMLASLLGHFIARKFLFYAVRTVLHN
jgi:hypothetical protein